MSRAKRRAHWERVYTTKRETEVSWFQATAAPSLELLALIGATPSSAIALDGPETCSGLPIARHNADNDPERGRTNIRGASTSEIFILRGTEPKDQSGITITTKEPSAKVEAPKTRTVRRGKRTYTVPAD